MVLASAHAPAQWEAAGPMLDDDCLHLEWALW